MTVIRPDDCPPVTAGAAGDIFLIDGTTGVALAATCGHARNANGNVALNNVVEGFTSTATAAGTTTLTVTSAAQQFFTGTAAQTVILPVTSALELGQGFYFQNQQHECSHRQFVRWNRKGHSYRCPCHESHALPSAGHDRRFVASELLRRYRRMRSGVRRVQNSLTLAGTDGTVLPPWHVRHDPRTDAAQHSQGTQTFGALVATTVNGNTVTAGTGVLTSMQVNMTVGSSLAFAGTDGTTMTFHIGERRKTDTGQTFTGTNVFGVLTTTTIKNGNTFTAGTGGPWRRDHCRQRRSLHPTRSRWLERTAALLHLWCGGSSRLSGRHASIAATTSAQLAGVFSDETGTGSAVFATSPTLVTSALGVTTRSSSTAT